MAGYSTVLFIRRLEQECNDLGLMMCYGRYSNSEFGDTITLKPKDANSLPIFSRDAEVFCGTLEELNRWIQGVIWARDYDKMLKLSDDAKRERKEQDCRNRQLLSIIKGNKDDTH